MKRSVTFTLPPSPRAVIQRSTVIIAVEDAYRLVNELVEQLAKAVAPYNPGSQSDNPSVKG